MKKHNKLKLFFLLFLVVFSMSSCGKTAENEHLPEYCQTYSSFTSFASRDFYDLLIEQDIEVDKRHYLDAIAAISLEFVVDDPTRDIDLSGIQCFQNLTDISLTGQSFRDLSPISALSNIQSIELVGTSVVSIDSFKNLSKIKSLVISDTYTLQSVDGVEEMTKLTNLDLSNNGIVNIEGLNNLINLTTLYLNDNDIIEFPSINQLEQLETLNISNNDISILGDDLSGLTSLKFLQAQNNEICDISALDDLIRLEVLNLSNNNLGCLGEGVSPNFDSLENAPNLTELHLDNNGLTSIAGLEGRDINLEILYLNDNELTDITPIAEYTDIVELYIENNQIENIDDLSDMTGLTSIDLSHNVITDFSDLLTISNLVDVNLSYNQISVIPDISTAWPDVTTLDLSSNQLTDTSGVQGHPSLETLNLLNNGLVELSGISDLPNLDTLIIFDDDLAEDIPEDLLNPNRIRIIRDSFTNVPELVLHEDNIFTFGFEFEDNLEIYNSIIGLTDIATIQFNDAEIDVIDENSLNLPNLTSIYLSNNNIEDIRFILGNPSLARINISGNPVGNLEVFSGLTTTDLDNLIDIDASDVDADNNLVDAFIELPSIESINLTNTSVVSINNSFNELPTLILLNLEGDNLTSIVDSFNDIFETYSEDNVFNLSEGRIGYISGSFNNGYYHVMDFELQTTILPTTVIDNSFNNLTIEAIAGIDLHGSNFASITDSFNSLVTDNLFLNESNVETITNSFVGSTIETIDLSDNYIETIPSMNQITSVTTLLLNNNVLTTVSFLDGVTDLQTLNISNQYTKDTIVATMVSLDGINNMPDLTNFSYANIGITEIHGLMNIGITNFNMSYATNSDIYITTIHPDSFTATALTSLDLGNHTLANVDFLDNLDILTTLNIGVDLADLSDFQAQDFETTLTTLTLQNVQEVADFSYLSNYDDVVTFTLDAPQTTINNLDGMDALSTINMNYLSVTTITNSFNTFLVFNEDANFVLDEFPLLTTITNSFDMYGTAAHTATINLEPYITITDSFNNVVNLTINNNNNELTPNFDTLSFDDVESITFEYADYSSFVFLNGYTSLETLTIANLDVDITDLSNDAITDLSIINADSTVDALTVDLSSNAIIDFTSFRNGLITLDTDAKVLDLTATNADFNIILDNTTVSLNIDANDVTVTSLNVTTIVLSNYETNNTIFNTDLLATITRTTTTEVNAQSFTVNSDVLTLDYSTRTPQLTINNDVVTTLDVIVSGGALTLNNAVTDILVTLNATQFDVSYNTLEQVTLHGSVGTVNITSTALDTFSSTADITILNVDSAASILGVSGSDVSTATVTDNVLTDVTLDLTGATITLYTTNNQTLNTTVIASEFNLVGNNVPTLVFDNTSVTTTTNLLNNNYLASISYGTASLGDIDINTGETTFSLVGSTGTVTLNGAQFTSLTVDAANVDLTVLSSGATLAADLNLDTVVFDNTNLSTLNLVGTSTVRLMDIENTSLINTINTSNAPITTLTVNSESNSLNIDAQNTTTTIINGSSYTSLTVDGGNQVTISSLNNTGLTADIIATNAVVNGDYTTLSLASTTNVSNLDLASNSLINLTANNATLADVDITSSASNLDVSGTAIADLLVNDSLSTLDLVLSAGTVVDITSTTGVAITTNTDAITLTSSGNSSINSSTLETLAFDLGTNDLALNLNKIGLNVTLDGAAGTVTLNGTNIGLITTTANTDINTLELVNLNVNNLDFTTGVIDNLDMSTTLATITITGDEVETVLLSGANLSTVTVNSSNAAGTLTINSSNGILDLDGSITSLTTINNNSLTNLDISGFSTSNLTLQANSLSTLDTGTSVSNHVDITNNQLLFNLSGSFDTVEFTGNVLSDLNVTSATVTILTTNSDSLDLAITSPSLNVIATSLSSIEGSVNALTLGNTDASLSIDLVATTGVDIINNTATSLTLANTSNIPTLDIDSSSLTSLVTNDATITNLVYSGDNNRITITTKCDDVDLSSSGIGVVTLNYQDTTALSVTGTTLDELQLNAPSITVANILGSIDIVDINSNNLLTVNVLTGATIQTLDINSTSVTTVDTNDATITNLVYQGNDNNTTITTESDNIDLTSTGTQIFNVNYEGATALTVDSTSVTEVNVDMINGTTLNLDGVVTTANVTGNGLTTMNVLDTASITSLDVQSTGLTTLDTNNAAITTLSYTGNNTDVNITTKSDTLNLSSTGTGTVTVNYEGIAALDFSSSTIDSVYLNISDATNVSLDGSATEVVVNSNSITTLTVENTAVIDELYNFSSSLLTINTNNVAMSKLSYVGIDNDVTINTQITNIVLVSGNGIITLNYQGATATTVEGTSVLEMILNAPSTNTLTLTGSINDLTITGNGLTTITTTGLFVDTSFTMNNTLIADLDFMSTDMLSLIDQINMNTLSNANMESIVTALTGRTITLSSPIVDIDVYNYHNAEEHTRLTDQETADNARFNQFETDKINDAWAVIVANQYMDHLDETNTKTNEIQTQTYQSVDDYYNSYLTNDGINEGDLTQQQINDIKASIQSVLDDPALTFTSGDIDTLVDQSIDDDADTFATNEVTTKTYTLS